MSVVGTRVRYGHMSIMGTCPLWAHVRHGHVSVMENLTKRSLFSTQRQIKQKITIELIMSCHVKNI